MKAVPDQPPPPHIELTELVFRVAGRLRDCFTAAAADLDLPPAQAQALANLDFPAPMRKLADVMACDASNVTGIVDGLERRGLVLRQPDPHDRRVKLVVLTDEGHRRRQALRTHSAEAAAQVFGLPPDDQRALRDLLTRVATNHTGQNPYRCAP
ncbi:DNA-binding transcriptional regulator, MarR family [Thermomonospora echinospora]|uniref:DNA-binding transcriptional regulator, MarR family n=1 Tax=Thermomonospora echinospora TaxID=1992 RepID=A0A1H5SEM3_9ACTN|nr:MarR family winged helix-turn-helix transcriptional regulator [Thermomonospora echinospora]SEF49042.1 DNA-binding transcriptional regulator, MarR family [Thermomonospora echinospora]